MNTQGFATDERKELDATEAAFLGTFEDAWIGTGLELPRADAEDIRFHEMYGTTQATFRNARRNDLGVPWASSFPV